MESSKLMWESFGKLREQVQKLEQELNPAPLKQNGLRLINSTEVGNADSTEQDAVEQPALPSAHSSARVIQFTASGKRAH
jgi:hypothetical protein